MNMYELCVCVCAVEPQQIVVLQLVGGIVEFVVSLFKYLLTLSILNYTHGPAIVIMMVVSNVRIEMLDFIFHRYTVCAYCLFHWQALLPISFGRFRPFANTLMPHLLNCNTIIFDVSHCKSYKNDILPIIHFMYTQTHILFLLALD